MRLVTQDEQQLLVRRLDRFPPSADGFTYLWVLLAIGLIAAGLAATAEVASTAARRDKEAELLFVGDQFARAIVRYRAAVPNSQVYPQRLEDLLADNRVPTVRRHLRRIYPDPMTGRPDWGLIRGPNGGIVGVYSTATAKPLKQANFPKDYAAFANASSYRDWVFAAGVTAGGPAGAGTVGGSATGGGAAAGGAVGAGTVGGGTVGGARPDGSSPVLVPLNPGAAAATPAPPQTPAVGAPLAR